MKKLAKSISAIFLSFLFVFASATICATAAEDDELILDGRIAYKVGDTITYDLCLQTPKKIMGIQMWMKYDSEFLKIDPDSVETPNFPGSTINPNLDGGATFNWVNVTRLVNFSEKATMIKLNFEVIKAGEANVTYFIEEMFTSNLENITEYTFTVDYSDNGTVIEQGDVPILQTDPGFVNEHQGEFSNYADGKGADNADVDDEEHQIVTSPNKVNEPVANNNANNQNVSPQATDSNGNVVATNAQGEILPTDDSGNYLDAEGETLATDASGNYVDKSGGIYQDNTPAVQQNSLNVVPIIIIIAVVLAAIAIVVVIVLKSRNKTTDSLEEADDSEADDSESEDSKADDDPGEEMKEKSENADNDTSDDLNE